MKRLFLLCSLAIAPDIAAADVNASEVRTLVEEVADLVDGGGLAGLTQDELDELHVLVKNAKRVLVDGGAVPGTQQDKFAAICHVDDDPNFDWNQDVIGELRGNSPAQIAAECAAIASAQHGSDGSSRIKDIEYIRQPHPDDRFAGTCHVDDDTNFDANQFVIGEFRAKTVQTLTDDCDAVAEAMFGDQGTFSVMDISYVATTNTKDRFSGECHVDDDTNFDWNQFVIGTISSETVQALADDCAAMAFATAGDEGTWRLKDITYIGSQQPTDKFVGECHVDDDTNFDWNQFVYPTVYGPNVASVENDCSAIAEARFGADGTSRVKNLTPLSN